MSLCARLTRKLDTTGHNPQNYGVLAQRMASSTDTPQTIGRLASEVTLAVEARLGVAPDMTPETLPLVDRYLRDTVADLPQPEREPQLTAIGAYFGEVVRRQLDGRWTLTDEPRSWRIELSSCFLHFKPIGMAAEAMVGCEVAGQDGSFATLDELTPDLQQMLQQAPPLPEDEYYSLTGRAEVLAMVADWLTGRRIRHEKEQVRPIPAEAYRLVLDSQKPTGDARSSVGPTSGPQALGEPILPS